MPSPDAHTSPYQGRDHTHLLAAIEQADEDMLNGGTYWGDEGRRDRLDALVAAVHEDDRENMTKGLPEGLLDVEQFALHGMNVAELHPGEDPVDVPQVALVFMGVPALRTLTGQKTYVTAMDGTSAESFGTGIVQAAQQVKKAEAALAAQLVGDPPPVQTPETAGGVILAGPADLAQAKAIADAERQMRAAGA